MSTTTKSRKTAQILAIANQKGGVAKTTTAITLGAALALRGKKVLIIDLDPHACASVHLGFYPDETDHTMHDLFIADAKDYPAVWDSIIKRNDGQKWDFAPGSIRLAELDVDLRNQRGKGLLLKQALEHLKTRYDYIVLDCPPHVGIILANALVAATLLIIPIQTDFLALHGLKLLFDTLHVLNKVMPEPLQYMALATMYDKRAKACTRVLELIQTKMHDTMFQTIIGIDTRFRDACALGKVIFDIAPQSRGAIAYDELAQELIKNDS